MLVQISTTCVTPYIFMRDYHVIHAPIIIGYYSVYCVGTSKKARVSSQR